MNTKTILIGSTFCLFVMLASVSAFQFNSSNYFSKMMGVSEGENNASSSSYQMYLVVGAPAGNSSSSQYQAKLGFRYELVSSSTDADSDGVSDYQDTFIGNATFVTTAGISALNVTLDGQPTNGTFTGTHIVTFKDSGTTLFNFTHNFSNGTLDLRKVNVTVAASSIIVNLGEQLSSGESKTLYLADASFASLCAKDAVISRVGEISDACTGSAEYNLVSCLGNSAGIRVGSLLCTDRGSVIEVNNFTHSGVRGTVAVSSSPSSSSGTSSGGGGEGGGGATPVAISPIVITPDELNILMSSGVSTERTIQITNRGTESLLISIGVIGKELGNVLTTEKNITLGAGETKILTLSIAAVQKGLIVGTLVFVSGVYRQEIPVAINVKTENFLFDAKLNLSQEQRSIHAGETLQAQVQLLQVGPHEKVDVTVTYVIKNREGVVYFNDTETFFVLANKSYVKQIATDLLPPGKYVLGMDVSYSGAYATSSVTFEVLAGARETSSVSATSWKYVFGALVIIFLLVIVFLLLRNYRGRRKHYHAAPHHRSLSHQRHHTGAPHRSISHHIFRLHRHLKKRHKRR